MAEEGEGGPEGVREAGVAPDHRPSVVPSAGWFTQAVLPHGHKLVARSLRSQVFGLSSFL